VEQTSIAVLLNKAAAKKVPISTVKTLVAAAAGLNLSKGDQLAVSTLPFAATPALAAGAGASSSQLVPTAEKVAGLLLLIFGLYFFALRSSKKRKPLYQEIPIGELPSMVPVDDDPTGEIPAVGATTLQLGPDAVLAQVNDFIDQQPSEAAQLLRMWADERQGSEQPVRALQA
jgi:flagellar M-ring protein FliF